MMPLQGYYWFYKRAVTPLNEKQTLIYNDLCKKLDRIPTVNPLMKDFEEVLIEALKKLDKEFLEQL